MKNMTTWRECITQEMKERGESWDDVVAMTTTHAELDDRFDAGYGGTNGCSFTLWTSRRVYFPGCYDGAEWVASVPRDPCDEATVHVGGG